MIEDHDISIRKRVHDSELKKAKDVSYNPTFNGIFRS
jgi:hypothetical protein